MRKLILIAVLATMSTTSCYANLSLASNEPSPAATEQKGSPALSEPQPSKTPEAKPATVAKATNLAKHHRRHVSGWAAPVHTFYQHCM
jgi:hypothetical protein